MSKPRPYYVRPRSGFIIFYVTLSGFALMLFFYPGRCPELSYFAPLGRVVWKRIDSMDKSMRTIFIVGSVGEVLIMPPETHLPVRGTQTGIKKIKIPVQLNYPCESILCTIKNYVPCKLSKASHR
jgi:hypothetical protein